MSRIRALAGAALGALANPTRQDLVAAVGELTALPPVLTHMRNHLLATDEGRRLLRARPSVHSRTVDLERLRGMREGTLGREYVRFLETEQVTPDSRAPIVYLESTVGVSEGAGTGTGSATAGTRAGTGTGAGTAHAPLHDESEPVDTSTLTERAYVLLRYRQTHDFLHVVTGMPTTLVAELALKWFEFVQTGLPMTAIGGTFGALRLTAPWRFQDFERDRSVYPKATMPAAHVHHAQAHAQAHPSHDSSIHDYATAYLPWALRNGARARPLLAVFWEERFDQDLQSVRRELGVEPWRGVAAERLGANSGVR